MATHKDNQWLKKRGVSSDVVIDALEQVPREPFEAHDSQLVPEDVVGRMISALELRKDSNVLHVGTGTGYESAVLSSIATSVYSVERDPVMARDAARTLADNGYKNVQVLTGNTLKQYAANAPYDGILVSASMLKLPQRLAKRLAIGGCLVAPIGRGKDQRLVRLRRLDEKRFKEEKLGDLTVKPLLGDILVDMGVVDRDGVELAALEADVKGKRLGEALLEGAYVEEADIYKALAKQNNHELFTAERMLKEMDRSLVGEIPRAFLIHNRMLPLHNRDGTLHLVTTDANANTRELATALGLQYIEISLITPTDFQLVWTALETKQSSVPKELGGSSSIMLEDGGAIDHTTIGFFEKTIIQAIEARASDIHFERHEQNVTIRFRIDGDLRAQDLDVTADQLGGIVQLVKVSGRMDQSESRRPQMGHFQRRVSGRVYDIRARTQPGIFGETVMLRILPQDTKILTIEDLGITTDTGTEIRNMLQQRSGLVLIVGPAGSGKSTTSYALANIIAQDETRKVVSVEHPRTYTLSGVHQLKIDPSRGFDVAAALTTVIGDDANAIVLGDINNIDVAHAAIRASQAGHLVIGTVYGRDTVDGPRTLIELGVDPNAVATEVLGCVSQLLVKRVCTECRESAVLEEDLLHDVYGEDIPDGLVAFHGKGCDHCMYRGTRGRIAVTEFMRVNSPLRQNISAGGNVAELRNAALTSGLTTLLDTGSRFVQAGVIPQEELQWIPTW